MVIVQAGRQKVVEEWRPGTFGSLPHLTYLCLLELMMYLPLPLDNEVLLCTLSLILGESEDTQSLIGSSSHT